MTDTKRTALVGLHEELYRTPTEIGLSIEGYISEMVATYEEMRERASSKPYDLYLMDANLGTPGSLDVRPAIGIYSIVKERIERGDARFVALSSRDGTIKSARENGVPADDKETFDLQEFLKKEIRTS